MTDHALPPLREVREGGWTVRLEEALCERLLDGGLVAAAERSDLPDLNAGGPAGRGPHGRLDLGGGIGVIVRRYRHGGLFAPLTGDRFLGKRRFLREFELARRAWATRVPTSRPVAVGWRGGVLSTRGFIATLEIGGACDLLELLTKPLSESARVAAAVAVAKAVLALHEAGVCHADLHLKNLLVGEDAAEEGYHAWVIDLDLARQESGALPLSARIANLARLYRSVEKHRHSGVAIGNAEVKQFCKAYFGDDARGRRALHRAVGIARLRARIHG